MKMRVLYSLAVGVGLSGATMANPPAPLQLAITNPNQALADDVAHRLRTSGYATGADVSIVAQEGVVTLRGNVKDAAQKARIVAEAKTVSGVVAIRDGLCASGTCVVQVQDPPIGVAPIAPTPFGQPPATFAPPASPYTAPPTPLGPSGLPFSAPPAPPPPAPIAGGLNPGFNPIVEPVPLGVPGQAAPDFQAPNLPPYAWPTYAPYNNVSRVAYPEAYPYNAFPFIGPFYPFPKVPLGWRKVTLEWEDGHWYLGRQSAPQDYWRTRFW